MHRCDNAVCERCLRMAPRGSLCLQNSMGPRTETWGTPNDKPAISRRSSTTSKIPSPLSANRKISVWTWRSTVSVLCPLPDKRTERDRLIFHMWQEKSYNYLLNDLWPIIQVWNRPIILNILWVKGAFLEQRFDNGWSHRWWKAPWGQRFADNLHDDRCNVR